MLSKKRCPHTGVVNFYAECDPLIAIGSVSEAGSAHYAWHCYIDQETSGISRDVSTAEAHLRKALEKRKNGRSDRLMRSH